MNDQIQNLNIIDKRNIKDGNFRFKINAGVLYYIRLHSASNLKVKKMFQSCLQFLIQTYFFS